MSVGLVALVPALLLFGLYRWTAPTGAAAPPIDATVTVPPATPPLSTTVMSFRRLPSIVVGDVNDSALAAELAPFFATLNDRSCSVVAVDGRQIGAHNPDIAVIPASNQKLIVAATALERLGADFTYTTTVEAASAPVAGVVGGDLYLVGGGDPLLSSDWYPDSNLDRFPVTSPTSLDTLADNVVSAGVTRVTGGVVGDGTRYDDEYFAPGWGAGVNGLEAGPYDALMANDDRVFGVDTRPNDPNVAAATEFTRLLRDRGVVIDGEASSGAAPVGALEIATIDSAPLSAVVAEMLGNSDNNTAELMVKELGRTDSTPGTREAGLAVIGQQLVDWGIDAAPVVLADGSGLSPDNRVTCSALAAVVERYRATSPIGSGLPVAATSGTLSDVFVGVSVAGRLLGKTGTLTNPPFNVDPPAVKALSGYLPVDGGGEIEFVLILNGPTIADQSEYRSIWYQLGDTLDTYPAGPTVAQVGPR